MVLPTLDQAEALLQWAEALNPTFWATHSRIAAHAARTIATAAGMDGEAAYIMGLLHDIGRYEGWKHIRHIYAGYVVLMDKGYTDAARICITHSFALQDIKACMGENDCTPEEYAVIVRELAAAQYDDYDRLIQLCDSLAGNPGVVLIEKRLLNVAMRYPPNDLIKASWQARFDIMAHFEGLVTAHSGGDVEKSKGAVYRLFPDVATNTFDY